MMHGTLRALGAIILGVSVLTGTPSGAADLVTSVEDAYAVRNLRRTPFDPRAALALAPEESRFLEDLFALTDEAVLLKCFDSDEDGRCRYTMHSAFVDPTSAADAIPRESIEARTIAFFD